MGLSDWFCALWSISVPYLEAQVEDGQGDRRQEDGRSALLEVERDGPVQFRTTAALGLRHIQELRGLVACGVHGRERCGDVGQGHLLRAQGGSRWRRQEEVRSPRLGGPEVEKIVEVPQIQYV